MCHFKRYVSSTVKQHKLVVLPVESKLFVQHSVDVEGEGGRCGRRSDWAPIAADGKGFLFSDQPRSLTETFRLTERFEMFYQLVWAVYHLLLLLQTLLKHTTSAWRLFQVETLKRPRLHLHTAQAPL